jgi:hypothetical protein
MADDRSFLDRWSRRKAEVKTAEEQIPSDPVSLQTSDLPNALPDEDRPDDAAEEAVDVDDLPDVDSLDKDSDYTAFMKEGVPEDLRKMALRKLWRSDPVLANVDGLNDYDEDFRAMTLVGEVIKTAYRPGSGYDEPEEVEEAGDEGSAEDAVSGEAAADGETEAADESGDQVKDEKSQDSEMREEDGDEPLRSARADNNLVPDSGKQTGPESLSAENQQKQPSRQN